MADKAISELVEAPSITPTDLFVLEQNGTAKKLTGQVLLNWLTAAADGHGGIQSIAKLSTKGLVDTYRITLADTTPFDFVVTNGKGINSIKKTSTEGLVDTYTITYTDGNIEAITITNGAKGDKGDNAYIWIKYASQEPTDASHSFGDVPNAWIGMYYGPLSSAPTDWKQYKWYQWKGGQGKTGDPAKLVSASVSYQVGTSGTVVPSGSWSPSIPVVSQGQYLWTKIVQQFNSGNPITAYSVSRMGMDGLGSVSSVAGVSPTSDGNVPLTADTLGALSKNGGTMQGAINMNGQQVRGLNDPVEDDEAANKRFVTDQISGITPSGIGALSMELLWQNADTSSDFGQKNIPVDLSNYEFFVVIVRMGTTANSYASYLCRKDIETNMFASTYTLSKRNVHYSETDKTVNFTNAAVFQTYANATETAYNAVLIPYQIYGIKGVS